MAAQPIMLQSGTEGREFWEEFQRRIAARVRDCNVVAGESLWGIVKIPGSIELLVVASVTDPLDRVEVSFDAAEGMLVCIPGPALRSPALAFRWRTGGLTLNDSPCSVDAALEMALNELVSADPE